jgi:hypothetical protein
VRRRAIASLQPDRGGSAGARSTRVIRASTSTAGPQLLDLEGPPVGRQRHPGVVQRRAAAEQQFVAEAVGDPQVPRPVGAQLEGGAVDAPGPRLRVEDRWRPQSVPGGPVERVVLDLRHRAPPLSPNVPVRPTAG